MNVQISRTLLAALAVAVVGCGGGSSSSTGASTPTGTTAGTGNTVTHPESGPSPSPVTTPSPAPSPAPVDVPLPVQGQSCPLGNGTLQSACDRRSPSLQEEVEAAIDRVVQRRPSLFNLNDSPSAGVYRVLDGDAFHVAVVGELRGSGFCAQYEGFELLVKNSNDFSEAFDIVTTDGFIRRGSGAYRSTCTPASFPVDPAEHIHHVRVAFYGFRCQDGVQAPRNGSGELPVGCVGYVTATPKKADNTDVDSRIHGPDIEWNHRSGHEQIEVAPDDATFSAFNKLLVPVEAGDFVLCATVRGVEGCLNGKVTQ
jgi:hypothetical protein